MSEPFSTIGRDVTENILNLLSNEDLYSMIQTHPYLYQVAERLLHLRKLRKQILSLQTPNYTKQRIYNDKSLYTQESIRQMLENPNRDALVYHYIFSSDIVPLKSLKLGPSHLPKILLWIDEQSNLEESDVIKALDLINRIGITEEYQDMIEHELKLMKIQKIMGTLNPFKFEFYQKLIKK